MNFEALLKKKREAELLRGQMERNALRSFEQDFLIEYTHNSTAIEGNTLTLLQTKVVLEDGISVGGKTLREIYEVVNHGKAFAYVQKCISEGRPLTENIVKDVHALLMENILDGGIYRSVEVRISGAKHKPPAPSEMYYQVKEFYRALAAEHGMNPIELAARTHAEFVKIHPFVDGKVTLRYQQNVA